MTRAKISVANERLERLLGKAEIEEALTPGKAILVLPPEKELSRLAYLATQLCALRRRSQKCAVKTLPFGEGKGKRKKRPIEYDLNLDAMEINARMVAGSFEPKRFPDIK